MKSIAFVVVTSVIAVGCALHAGACEISIPEKSELPDWVKDDEPEGFVWVGSPKLAARVPESGHWNAMGADHNYRDKWWWWREGYRAREETSPQLVITATRLDATAPPVLIQHASNAFGPGWDLMVVGMEFPTSGCWEVVGTYRGQELKFVFKVGS